MSALRRQIEAIAFRAMDSAMDSRNSNPMTAWGGPSADALGLSFVENLVDNFVERIFA
jgi:hypothetical protein